LAIGIPGTGVSALAATTASASGSTLALSVGSNPDGAQVYVDGSLRGETPVRVGQLRPGDHRVMVVKNGYLENSRVVTVKPGEAGSINVKLTPRGDTTGVRLQADMDSPREEKGGGSGKKIALVVLGLAAVGGGVYLLLPKNKAPVAGTIGVTPAKTGMATFTSYSFSSVGSSDPDGDPLAYTWNYGDGSTGTGATSSHVYASAGTFQVTLTIDDGKKHTVTAPPVSVTVGQNLNNASWSGRLPQIGNNSQILRTTQTGSGSAIATSITLSGGYGGSDWLLACTGTCTGSGSGTVDPVGYPANVRFSANIAGIAYTFDGATQDGNTLTGTGSWSYYGVYSASGAQTWTRQ